MHHGVQLVYDIAGDSQLTIISLIVSCIAVGYAIRLGNKQINLSNEQGKIIKEQMKVTRYQAKLFEIQNMLIDMQIGYNQVLYMEKKFDKKIEEALEEKDEAKRYKLREEAIDLKDKTFALLDKVKIVQENMTKKQDVLDSMNID